MLCKTLKISGDFYEKYEVEALETYDHQFFSINHMRKLAIEAELCEENIKCILEFIEYASDDIKKFMWLYYFILFKTNEDFSDNISQVDRWMLPATCEDKYPGMMKACIYLAAAENLREWVAKYNLSENIFLNYYDRYRYFVDLNMVSHNTYGFCRSAYFLYGYAKPTILGIGRLNFEIKRYFDYCEVYENKEGKRFFAALPTRKYGPDGHISEDGEVPYYSINSDELTAHTFDNMGLLSKEPEKINLNEYKKILSPGDLVATIHIPAKGKLDIDYVKKSIRDADLIINKHLTSIKAFVSRTWFIDPGLRDVIKEGSNMRAFADLFDVICTEDNQNKSIFDHIFLTKKTDLKNLVPRNDFQRKMLARAINGEKIYWGYGLLKKEFYSDMNDYN